MNLKIENAGVWRLNNSVWLLCAHILCYEIDPG